MSEVVYEEVKEASPLIQFAAQQTKPLFGALKIYGTKQFPLYNAHEIGILLEIKNIDRVLKNYTSRECITAKIKTNENNNENKPIRLLTRHGMYRIMFENQGILGDIFREFVYMVLDKLSDDGAVQLKQIQTDMQAQFSDEIKKATDYLQIRIQNLEHEVLASSRITRRATEIMHNKEQEVGRLTQESQSLQMKIYGLEKKILTDELRSEMPEDEQFAEYLKAKYLKKYYIYLLPSNDDDYNIKNYNLNNPPDEDETMNFRLTQSEIRNVKNNQLVKEIYLENDSQFIELLTSLSKYATNKSRDNYSCSLYDIIDLTNEIRNKPVIAMRKAKAIDIENALANKKLLWESDCV